MSKKTEQPALPVQDELAAIGQIRSILEPFDIWAQKRILEYLNDWNEQHNVWGKGGSKNKDDADE